MEPILALITEVKINQLGQTAATHVQGMTNPLANPIYGQFIQGAYDHGHFGNISSDWLSPNLGGTGGIASGYAAY